MKPVETDLYDTLGVDPGATEEAIRRAYRKLARKHHPDVNPDDPGAEEKFKALSAAFEVLTNKEKRALYDEFGKEGLRGGFDPEQARAYQRWAEVPHPRTQGEYEDLLHPARAHGRGPSIAPIDGEDLFVRVELALGEALRGTELDVETPSRSPCTTCAGSGARPRAKRRACPTCDGGGQTEVVRGALRIVAACPSCGGSGTVRDACAHCQGAGYLTSQQTLRVRIPAGAADGETLRVRGRGTAGLFGGATGDVIVRIAVQPHAHFERDGLDLALTLPVTLAEAQHGGSIAVPTPTGSVQLKVPPRSKQGAVLRLKDRGVRRGADCGDLYVTLNVQLPDRADPELDRLLAETTRFYTRDVRTGISL